MEYGPICTPGNKWHGAGHPMNVWSSSEVAEQGTTDTSSKSFVLDRSLFLGADPVGSVAKLAEFLGLPRNDQLFEAIADQCSFDKMKEAKPGPKLKSPNESIYRKGIVGDWKNWFTVSQEERFQVECDEFDKQSTLFSTKC
ncbi:sulfotransferase 1B1-like [Octopus bimaculoides]|nr:sulfotransferase 1B1-like [Octopus bimaculoides]